MHVAYMYLRVFGMYFSIVEFLIGILVFWNFCKLFYKTQVNVYHTDPPLTHFYPFPYEWRSVNIVSVIAILTSALILI